MTTWLVAAAALVVLLTSPGCRKRKTPVRIETIEGESAILPRVDSPAPEKTPVTRTSKHSVDVGGKARTYLLVEPVTVDASKRYPLILVFHGDGGSAASFHDAWPFERASGKDAFVAYLDGLRATWDLESKDSPDIAFIDTVIADIEKKHPLDRTRFYATGYSSGGFLANLLACRRPGLLRAISSSAGGAPYNQQEKWSNGFPKCPGQKPVALLALHGERDSSVTIDSGRFSAEYWAYVNGCKLDEMETTGYRECHVYRGCPSGQAVGFCSIDTLGHWVWSESAQASWTFFQRQ